MEMMKGSRTSLYSFKCAGNVYAVNMDDIKEVFHLESLESITPIFHGHHAVAGYTNIRGEIYQIIKLGSLLGSEEPGQNSYDLILFKERIGPSFGIIVKESQETITVDTDQIEDWCGSSSNSDGSALSTHVMKLDQKLISIIDSQHILELV